MAVIETWLKSDLKKPVAVVQLTGNLFSGDNGGNKIGVEVLDNGSPATLSGGVTGYIIRADGATVVQTGTLSGNKAYIVLPESAYVVVGHVSIVIKVDTTTVGACTSYVYKTTTSVIVDPGSVVPDISELLAVIADCEAATTAANTAATAAGYVNIAMTKSGKTITITTTNRSNQQTSKTLVEPSASVTKSGNVITISVTDADGTTTQTMLDPANTLAPAFDSSASYNVGDLCIKDGVLYVFTSAHTGAWSAGDAVATNFAEQLASGLDTKAPAIEVVDSTASPVKTLTDGADGLPMAVTVGIEPVQSGSGDPSPTNVRPITGWTGCNVSRTGKNLFSTEIEQGAIDSTDGQKSPSSASNHSKRIRTKDYIFLKAGTYTISCAETLQAIVLLYGLDKTYITPYGGTPGNVSFTDLPKTITLDADYYMMFACKYSNNGAITPSNITNVQIEMNSSATAYNAPSCVTLPISFPAGAGTVYGGSLTVNKDGTGKLVVDRATESIDGTETFIGTATSVGALYASDDKFNKFKTSTTGVDLCDTYPAVTAANTSSMTDKTIARQNTTNSRLFIKDSQFANMTDTQLATYFTSHPVQYCGKLITPVEYDLTATEVGQILSMLGTNNLFCDTGDVLSVDYSADTKLYVDEQKDAEDAVIEDIKDMIADSDSMTTTESHAQGDVFICDNKLLRALSAIASGATITIGTNAEVINLADYIAEVIASIGRVGTNVNRLYSLYPSQESPLGKYGADFDSLTSYGVTHKKVGNVYFLDGTYNNSTYRNYTMNSADGFAQVSTGSNLPTYDEKLVPFSFQSGVRHCLKIHYPRFSMSGNSNPIVYLMKANSENVLSWTMITMDGTDTDQYFTPSNGDRYGLIAKIRGGSMDIAVETKFIASPETT